MNVRILYKNPKCFVNQNLKKDKIGLMGCKCKHQTLCYLTEGTLFRRGT